MGGETGDWKWRIIMFVQEGRRYPPRVGDEAHLPLATRTHDLSLISRIKIEWDIATYNRTRRSYCALYQ